MHDIYINYKSLQVFPSESLLVATSQFRLVIVVDSFNLLSASNCFCLISILVLSTASSSWSNYLRACSSFRILSFTSFYLRSLLTLEACCSCLYASLSCLITSSAFFLCLGFDRMVLTKYS